MLNNKEDFKKRTANTVKSILSKNNINCAVVNEGDGNHFKLYLEDTLKNRVTLKKIGFILTRGEKGNNYIIVKCH